MPVIIVLQIIIIILLISIIFSMGSINEEHQKKMSRLALNLALVQYYFDKLVEQLKGAEDKEDDLEIEDWNSWRLDK